MSALDDLMKDNPLDGLDPSKMQETIEQMMTAGVDVANVVTKKMTNGDYLPIVSEFYKKFVDTLVEKGFTREEALGLVKSHSLKTAGK